MKSTKKLFVDIDRYIQTFPKDFQKILKSIHKTIKEAAPEAEELISYQMPAYKFNGCPLVYFAAYKKPIGFYPTFFQLKIAKRHK